MKRTGLNSFSMMVALAGLAGFIGTGVRGLAWRTPRNTLWRDDPLARERAEAKRERRALIVERHAQAGAYGLRPYVGQRGYVSNYSINHARSV